MKGPIVTVLRYTTWCSKTSPPLRHVYIMFRRMKLPMLSVLVTQHGLANASTLSSCLICLTLWSVLFWLVNASTATTRISLGEEVSYFNWLTHQPNSANQTCAVMLSNGFWMDQDCDMAWPVICEHGEYIASRHIIMSLFRFVLALSWVAGERAEFMRN